MRKFVIALAGSAALLLTASCASSSYASGAAYNDGYYDNFYGRVWSGYWGPDAAYYYSTRRGRPFIRDDAQHFRRDETQGFHRFHMRDWHNRV